jgi:hypothetical protein
MRIYNLYVVRVFFTPDETDAPLVIVADSQRPAICFILVAARVSDATRKIGLRCVDTDANRGTFEHGYFRAVRASGSGCRTGRNGAPERPETASEASGWSQNWAQSEFRCVTYKL